MAGDGLVRLNATIQRLDLSARFNSIWRTASATAFVQRLYPDYATAPRYLRHH